MECVITLDIGTSHAKAALIDSTGKILSSEKSAIPLHRPEPNAAEHRAEELIEISHSLIRKVISGKSQTVKAIVPTGYQFGLLLLDQDRKPINGVSTLLDSRARSTYANFMGDFDAAWLYQRTGCPPVFHYPLARLHYFRETDPKLFRSAKYFISAKDFIIQNLTGELLTDSSTASATQLMRLDKEEWDTEVLSKIEIAKESLSQVVSAYHESFPMRKEIAETLGLPRDVKILVGLYDSAALGIGMNAIQVGEGFSNLGTSAMLRTVSATPILDKSGMRLQTYHFVDGLYLIGSGMNNGLIPLTWLRKQLSPCTSDELFSEIAAAPIGAAGLLCLPYFTGERDPKLGEHARGVMFGLRDIHTRAHIARAMLEGVTFHLASILENLAIQGVNIKSIYLGGGGCQYDVWTQMIADILKKQLHVPSSSEPALLGNAILAFSNLNGTSLSETARNLAQKGREIKPNPSSIAPYQIIRSAYEELVELSLNLFPKLADFG